MGSNRGSGVHSVNLERPRLARWLDALRASYWFLPSCLVVGAMVLAAGAVQADRVGLIRPESFPDWMRFREAEAARGVLTTVAGAMVTIVSLTFSISIVALTLASSQFGPRLLYNFMRDRKNQVVLGVLLGTFVYCLLALASVRSLDEELPLQLAVLGALALTLVSVGFLIFFLHHVAESIQASTVIANVGRELRAVIDQSLPEREEGAPAQRAEPPADAVPLSSPRGGFLQAVDAYALAAAARRADVEVWLERRAGHYLLEGGTVARVRGSLDEEAADDLRSALLVGHRRTLVQDLEFGFAQLVEIAVRALSPGVNDPNTAMNCIGELGNALGLAAGRGEPETRVEDEDGRVRVHLLPIDFAGLVGTAFDQVRQQAARDPAVALRVLETLAQIVPLLRTEAQRSAVRRQGRLAHELALRGAHARYDREALDERLEVLESALGPGREEGGPW